MVLRAEHSPQTLARVFNLATDYTDGHNRIVGTTALSSVDSFNRNRARLQPIPLNNSRQRSVSSFTLFTLLIVRRANSVDEPVRRGQRPQVDNRIKMGMQIDDRGFQALLLETQVLTAREHLKWNYEALTELIEGPMLNPKRLEEAIKVSKFGRRLMQFFHPQTRKGFADMKKTKSNMKWVKLGCTLIATLLSNPDGVRFLQNDDPFLKQLSECFSDIDMVRDPSSSLKQPLMDHIDAGKHSPGSYTVQASRRGDSYLWVPRDSGHDEPIPGRRRATGAVQILHGVLSRQRVAKSRRPYQAHH